MKLENQVCTLGQAQRLKELGVAQESLYTWSRYPGEQRIYTTQPANNQDADYREDVCIKPIAAAFTVAELGVMLPYYTHTERGGSGWRTTHVIGANATQSGRPYQTEAEARAALLIYLLESQRITVATVNQRLASC